MKRLNIAIIIAVIFALPQVVTAAGPLETLKKPVSEVINILNDPQFKTIDHDPALKKAQRDKIWEQTQQIFDYEFISKSALGRFHWQNTFSAKEQAAFVDVFSRFLGNTYIDKIQQGYENETVNFLSEELLSPKKALVKTTITQNKIEIPVDYLMRANDGQWRVYDINIEGVSLVQNYRSQFRSILLNSTAAQLIDQLAAKL